MPFAAGSEIFDGQWRVERLLNSGGQGYVYEVRSLLDQSRCALKELKEEYLDDDYSRLRFFREFDAINNLDCDYVVRVKEMRSIGAQYFFFEELMEGGSLREKMVTSGGPLGFAAVVDMIHRICQALLCIRQRGLVHRDIKPENILYSSTGVAKLADFGVCHGYGLPGMTHPGVPIGTLQYMSPDQLRGENPSVYFDIFSLGATAFEALTGQTYLPFKWDMSDAELILSRSQPASVREGRPDCPSELEQVVLRMLAR